MASVATALDLGGKEGVLPPAKHSLSLIEDAVYAMGELAGDRRANAHYVEPYKEEVARRVP